MRALSTLALAAGLVLLVGAASTGATVQKLTIVMREYSYTPSKVTLQASVPAEITLINRGKKPHEFMVYDRSMGGMMMGHDWVQKTNYFRGMSVTVQGGKARSKGGAIYEVEVAAGKTAVVKFTPTRKGTFEMACMIKGHYEGGQVGTLTVR